MCTSNSVNNAGNSAHLIHIHGLIKRERAQEDQTAEDKEDVAEIYISGRGGN